MITQAGKLDVANAQTVEVRKQTKYHHLILLSSPRGSRKPSTAEPKATRRPTAQEGEMRAKATMVLAAKVLAERDVI